MSSIGRAISVATSLFLALLIAACATPAQKYVESGGKLEQKGNIITALDYYLSALDNDPKNEPALQGASRTAKPSYDQQIAILERLEQESRTEEAVAHLEIFKAQILKAAKYVRLSFATINFDERIARNKNATALKLIESAESEFKAARFDAAITKFKDALALAPDQGGKIRTRISDSLFEAASESLKNSRYRDAAERYAAAHGQTPGYRDANRRAALIHERLGDHYLGRNMCRNAFKDFELSASLSAAGADLNRKTRDAFACAKVRVAFLDFTDRGPSLAGTSVGEYVRDSAISRLEREKSKFLSIYDRDQLQQIYTESTLRDLEGGKAPSNLGKGVAGADFIIFGRITQVLERAPRQNQSRRSSQYSIMVTVPYYDKGKEKERYETRSFPMSYSVVTAQSYVKVQGTLRVVRARDAFNVLSRQFSEEELDRVEFADNFSAIHDLSSATVDPEIQRLASAKRPILDTSVLSQRVMDRLTALVAQEILKSVDAVPPNQDPQALNLPF